MKCQCCIYCLLHYPTTGPAKKKYTVSTGKKRKKVKYSHISQAQFAFLYFLPFCLTDQYSNINEPRSNDASVAYWQTERFLIKHLNTRFSYFIFLSPLLEWDTLTHNILMCYDIQTSLSNNVSSSSCSHHVSVGKDVAHDD